MVIDRKYIKQTAKQSIKGKKPNVFLITIVYLAISYILTVLYNTLSGFDQMSQSVYNFNSFYPEQAETVINDIIMKITPAAFVLIIAISIMATIMQVGYMSYCLLLSRNLETRFKNIFDGFAFFLKIIWLSFLQGFFIFLWSLLLIVPGIIAAYRYRQSYYIIFDNPDMSALDCIRQSKTLMKGYKGDLFILDLSFIGWWLLDGVVAAFLYLPFFRIWLDPYTGVTYANFYNALIPSTPVKNTPDWEIPV